MILMKFGGASLGTTEKIHQAHATLRGLPCRRPVALVVSALMGTTDLLFEIARLATYRPPPVGALLDRHLQVLGELGLHSEVIEEPTLDLLASLEEIRRKGCLDRHLLDRVVSFGERAAARIVAAAFTRLGSPATPVDADRAGLIIDGADGQPRVTRESRSSILRGMPHGNVVPIITGYIARDPRGHVVTLGRNGSDTSASLFAAALGSREIRVYKEVPGILTAPPGIIVEPRVLPRASCEFLHSLADLGCPVLHPRAIEPARAHRIPIRILRHSTGDGEDGDDQGTVVTEAPSRAASLVLLRERRCHRLEPGLGLERARALRYVLGRSPEGSPLLLIRRGETLLLLQDDVPEQQGRRIERLTGSRLGPARGVDAVVAVTDGLRVPALPPATADGPYSVLTREGSPTEERIHAVAYLVRRDARATAQGLHDFILEAV